MGDLAHLAAGQLAIGDGDAQHGRITLDVPAVLQAQRAELVFPRAGRPGGAPTGLGTGPRAGGRVFFWSYSSIKKRCRRLDKDQWDLLAGHQRDIPAEGPHDALGQCLAEMSWAPSQMPGRGTDEQRRQQGPVDVAQRRGRHRPPGSVARHGQCRYRRCRVRPCGDEKEQGVPDGARRRSTTGTPGRPTARHSRRSGEGRDSGIQRSSRSPSACQLCLKATTTAVHQGNAERERQRLSPAPGDAVRCIGATVNSVAGMEPDSSRRVMCQFTWP